MTASRPAARQLGRLAGTNPSDFSSFQRRAAGVVALSQNAEQEKPDSAESVTHIAYVTWIPC